MNTEKELKMGKVMDNLIISFSLIEAARVFSVGLCTIGVSCIAINNWSTVAGELSGEFKPITSFCGLVTENGLFNLSVL